VSSDQPWTTLPMTMDPLPGLMPNASNTMCMRRTLPAAAGVTIRVSQ
jgi:hypothetical protein